MLVRKRIFGSGNRWSSIAGRLVAGGGNGHELSFTMYDEQERAAYQIALSHDEILTLMDAAATPDFEPEPYLPAPARSDVAPAPDRVDVAGSLGVAPGSILSRAVAFECMREHGASEQLVAECAKLSSEAIADLFFFLARLVQEGKAR